MINRIKNLLKKNKRIVLYLIFGVLTTLVDFAICFLLYTFVNHHIANIVGWICAVVFAFFTNRRFVFESQKNGAYSVGAEFFAFCGGRVSSLLFQEASFLILVDILMLNEYYVKLPVSFGVVIINYFLSKMIFTSKKTKNNDEVSK